MEHIPLKFYSEKVEGSEESLRYVILKVIDDMHLICENYLDLGCSEASFTKRVAHTLKANNTYGADISEKSLKGAQEREICSVKLDLNSPLPFKGETFDIITAFEIIEHLVNTDNFISEAFRLLKKGGVFIISTPNLASWLNRLILLSGYLPWFYEVSFKYRVGKPIKNKVIYGASGHLRLYTLKALRDHLEIYGFKIEKVAGAFEYDTKFLRNFDRLFQRIPSLAAGIIVVAVKQF